MQELNEQELAERINVLSRMFDSLTQERYEKGQDEDGPLGWLADDTLKLLAASLADTANYARMEFIKVLLFSEALAQVVPPAPEVGAHSFKKTGEEWKK